MWSAHRRTPRHRADRSTRCEWGTSDGPRKIGCVFPIALRSLSWRVVALNVRPDGVMFPQIGAPTAGTLHKVVQQFASSEKERPEPIQADMCVLVVQDVIVCENHTPRPFGLTPRTWPKVSHNDFSVCGCGTRLPLPQSASSRKLFSSGILKGRFRWCRPSRLLYGQPNAAHTKRTAHCATSRRI
jgi:hypothetical protein